MKVVWALLQANLILIWNHFKNLHSVYFSSLISCLWLLTLCTPAILTKPPKTMSLKYQRYIAPILPGDLYSIVSPAKKPYPTNMNFLYSVKPFSNPARPESTTPSFCLLLLCHSFNSTSKSNRQQDLPTLTPTTITTSWTIWGQGYCFTQL